LIFLVRGKHLNRLLGGVSIFAILLRQGYEGTSYAGQVGGQAGQIYKGRVLIPVGFFLFLFFVGNMI